MRLASRDTLSARHFRLREALGAAHVDALLVTHLPNVFYLTNMSSTAGFALIMPERLYLILDFRYDAAARQYWDGPYGCPDSEIVRVERSYDETLAALVLRLKPARLGIEGANLSINRAHQLAAATGATLGTSSAGSSGPSDAGPAVEGTALVPTEGLVEKLRLIKDAHEIEMLRRGAALLSEVAREVILEIRPGMKEQEFAARIDWRIKASGFERCSFETIVASGPNSALPHAHAGERVMSEGDLVVLDFGGVYGGYCVDLTRTVALGEPTPEMDRVFQAVRQAQQVAIGSVRPGVPAGVIDQAARETLGQHGLAEAFGHSTGHGLGVEIHETPRIGPRRGSGDTPSLPDDAVEPGMVFTIEPGAYLPGWGGVRIEDDVLVTSDGVEVLTDVPAILRTHTHGIRRD